MFNYDPRFATYSYGPHFGAGFGTGAAYFDHAMNYCPAFHGTGYAHHGATGFHGGWNTHPAFGAWHGAWNTHPGFAGFHGTATHTMHLSQRIEELHALMMSMYQAMNTAFAAGMWNSANMAATYPAANVQTPNFNGGVVPFQRPLNWNGGMATETPVRIRESDTTIYCDIFMPQLTSGDVDVEVNGNRVVCRTRVPVARFFNTWSWMATAQLPRGFEFFELPDGCMECSWLCPVQFQAKDVEATMRDGFLSICVRKLENTTNRQNIKVAKENGTRRVANEMNS